MLNYHHPPKAVRQFMEVPSIPPWTTTPAVATVRLNKSAFDLARQLIREGRVHLDDRPARSEYHCTVQAENEFIRLHGLDEYGRWHLGIDEGEDDQTKGRYKFPYGDFTEVHPCAVLCAEGRAGQSNYTIIQMAAAHLRWMMDTKK